MLLYKTRKVGITKGGVKGPSFINEDEWANNFNKVSTLGKNVVRNY